MRKTPKDFTVAELDAIHKLPEAIKIALGVTLHKSTGFRWATRGVQGANGIRVLLAHRRIGGELYTTVSDVLDFDAAINAPVEVAKRATRVKASLPPSAAERRRTHARLRELGVM